VLCLTKRVLNVTEADETRCVVFSVAVPDISMVEHVRNAGEPDMQRVMIVKVLEKNFMLSEVPNRAVCVGVRDIIWIFVLFVMGVG